MTRSPLLRLGSLGVLVSLPAWASTLVAQSAPRFGQSVSAADVNGDGFSDVIVGEPGHDGSLVDEGRVLVFHGSASGPASTPSWSRRGLQRGAHFGAAVAGLGDVNGDGFEDVAMGAPGFDPPRPTRIVGPGAAQLAAFHGAGAFVVFLGSPAGLQPAPALIRSGIQHEEHFGATLARAGDVNGDGFDDVLVGATGTDGGAGAAFVFLGSAAGPAPLPHWIGRPPLLAPGTGYGGVLAGGGDLNADGFDDVVVGLPDGGAEGRGTALAYYGSAAGLPLAPSWSLVAPSGDGPLDNGNNDWGASLSLGDANGNGFDDLLVSDPYYDGDLGHGSGQYLDTGVVFLLAGTSAGIGSTAARFTGSFSRSVAFVGDVSGDGRAEAVLTNPGEFFGLVRYGSTPYYWARLSYIGGDQFGEAFGASVSPAGDIDGDGRLDLLISDPLVDLGAPDDGLVYAYRGVAGELSGIPGWVLSAP